MGGRGREGGSRAKPGNQLVYIYINELSESLSKLRAGCCCTVILLLIIVCMLTILPYLLHQQRDCKRL